MPELEPSPDLYGSAAARSCLADFVELSAMQGLRPGEALLADYIADMGWNIFDEERWIEPSSIQAEHRSSEPPEVSRQVFAILESRSSFLEEAKYPFELRNGRLVRRDPDEECGAYLVLLAITLAHAYGLDLGAAPETVLQETVADVLSARGLLAVNFATIREQGTFSEAIEAAGEILLLSPTPLEGWRSINANDAGVDVIASVGWGDARFGQWSFVGQVTCGKSETWRKKCLDASPTSWAKYLNTTVLPQRFLAVPHHVEPRHMNWLTQEADGIVIDRLRITKFKQGVTMPETAICDAVFSMDVARLY